MKYSNLYDMHTHSIHSFDGNNSIAELFDTAITLNAKGIAVTDHCDIDGIENYQKLCKDQIADFKSTSMRYNALQTILGIEIGQGIYRKRETEDIYYNMGYDFVLASLHNLENMQDFYFLDYKQYDIKDLLTMYFSDLLKIAQHNCFDSLAHLTYPLRYIVAREHINVDVAEYMPLIDEIFCVLIANKKALEINTSGLFMEMKTTLPDINLIRRYKELGGKLITIGSDSHYAEKVFQGIEQGMELALSAGFATIAVYKNHEPILIPIK